MYVKKKGTDTVLEAQIVREPDEWSANPDTIFPKDTYFLIQNPPNGEHTFTILSPEAKEYDVCASNGQVVCSLYDLGRSVAYQSDIERVNYNVTRQMDELASFAELHKNDTICVPSKLDPNQAVGLVNPTLEQLGSFALKYDVLDYRARPETSINFEDKFAHKLSQIAETEYAIANKQPFAGYFTLIQGNDMLSVDYITTDYGIPQQNLVVADRERGDITMYAEEWICVELEHTSPIGEAHMYINDDYIYHIDVYGCSEQEMQSIVNSMEESLEEVLGFTRSQDEPSDPTENDDQEYSQVDD